MKEDIVEEPICSVCRRSVAEQGYDYPLCQGCRTRLKSLPFPIWVTIVILIVFALMAYSASRLPILLKAESAEKSAQKAEDMKDYQSAIVEYQKILALFPESERHKEHLAICYIKTGRTDKAIDILLTMKNSMYSGHVLDEMGFKSWRRLGTKK